MAKRKRTIKKLQKSEHRRYSMAYLTNNVGRGPKCPLKQVKIINKRNEIIETIAQKDRIEEAIIKQNKVHYSKVLHTKAYKDKIY